MIRALSLLLKELNMTVYMLVEFTLNDLLDRINESRFACNYVPEIDIVLNDQMEMYMQSI